MKNNSEHWPARYVGDWQEEATILVIILLRETNKTRETGMREREKKITGHHDMKEED